MQKANLITGVLLTAFTLWLMLYAIPNQTGEGPGYGLSPADLPKALSLMILILSLIQVFSSLRSLKKETDQSGSEEPGISVSHWIFWLKFGSLAAVSTGIMVTLGFITGGILFMIGIQLLAGQTRYVLMAILALGTPTLLYFAFWYGMGIMLPQGLLI